MRAVRSLVLPALVLVVTALAAPGASTQAPVAARAARVVLIVVDGLRPDQVTAGAMPRLYALGQRGAVFAAHHAAVPTVTRVNAPTMATGSYPETHGLLGNTVYSARTFPARGVSTSDHTELEAMAAAEGPLLTATTLGQALEQAGKRLVVYSAGSSGSAYLLSHPLGSRGAVVNPEMTRPDAIAAAVTAAVGPGPKESVPNTPRNRWIVDAWRALAPSALTADVTAFWFADPDATAHATGLGSQETAGALASVDTEIGRIEDVLRSRGELASTAIVVTSDHGFSTHTGDFRLAAAVAPFAEPLPDGSSDLVVTEGAINARRPLSPERLAALVEALQARPEVGAIFTAPAPGGSGEGVVPGTLAFTLAHWQHARSGVALVSGNWTGAANAAGVAGSTTQTGVAGHGTTSPYDIHNTLIIAGPNLVRIGQSRLPTSNADLAPTMLAMLGVPVPASMTGRLLYELIGGREPETMTRSTVTSRSRDGRYTLTAHVAVVGRRRYLDHTEVTRR